MHDKRLSAYNLGMICGTVNNDYGFPNENATQINVRKVIPFNFALSDKEVDKETYVHFFIDDYQFERVWKSPQRYVDLFKKYGGIIAPDFSLYSTMPIAMQIWNVYRNRWLSAYYAEQGIQVIPSVNWSDERSYCFCFEALPTYSTLVISSAGGLKRRVSKWHFINGLHEMITRLHPTRIVVYGELPNEWLRRFPNVEFEFIESLTKTMRSRIING